MSKKIFNKICVICGAKASGFNFDAITCESCKSFFRRNSLKQFNCFLGDNCEIDILSRNCCKKCRLKKCFAQGMKTDLIQTEEQKKLRRIKINENKTKIKEIIYEITKDINSTESAPKSDLNSDNTESTVVTENTNSSDFVESVEILEYDPNHRSTDSIPDNTMTADIEYSLVPIARPITDCSTKFNELEINRLGELQNAIQLIISPEAKTYSVAQDYWQIISTLSYKCDSDIRRIIKMSKRLNAFRSLCADDQIVLLKYGSIEIICLRMILNFDFHYYYWNLITNSDNSTLVKLEIFRHAKRDVYNNQLIFVRQMQEEWNSDYLVIDLLTAIILFDSNRPKLINREQIKLQQHIYLHLLQRYLHLRYGSGYESNTKISRLLNILSELHIMGDKIAMNWYERESENSRFPLLREIGDRDNLVIGTENDHRLIES